MTSEKTHLRQTLHRRGMRATRARIAVLQFMLQATSPVSHTDVCERLVRLGIENSTIYRILQDFANKGLIRRMELGDRVWRYEETVHDSRSEAEAKPHPHLLCTDCGSIVCLTNGEVQLEISNVLGPITEVVLKGHCPDCTGTTNDQTDGPSLSAAGCTTAGDFADGSEV